jgi:hypothetical protein
MQKRIFVPFDIDPKTLASLQTLAVAKGLSVDDLVSQAIDAYLLSEQAN